GLLGGLVAFLVAFAVGEPAIDDAIAVEEAAAALAETEAHSHADEGEEGAAHSHSHGDEEGGITRDHLHPNDEGYARMADAIDLGMLGCRKP
ncbi:MAG: CbtA family protein, partial [Stenotrophomonas sp.]|nr:CbtA family protein [Stenotrophomonas sp.]